MNQRTKQTIVWTLLPDPAAPAHADGTVDLSLVMSPRLSITQGDAGAVLPLSEYPVVADWPAFAFTLDVNFLMEDETSQPVSATLNAAPDLALWYALFPPSTPVRPFVFDRSVASEPVQSYPSHLVARSLREEYGRLFRSGYGSPDGQGEAISQGRRPTALEGEDLDRFVRVVAGEEREGGLSALAEVLSEGIAPDDLARDPAGWERLADFHQALAPVQEEGVQLDSPSARREFHAMVAALADHPTLMARLGLLRRVRVVLPSGLNGHSVRIQALVEHDEGFIQKYSPRTRCVVRGGRLALARADGVEAASYLPLNDTSKYTPIDVDVDSAGLALRSYAEALRRLAHTGQAPDAKPPALRSDGIFVAETNRQESFRAALTVAQKADEDLAIGGDGDQAKLDADNVAQGYRVDVFDEESRRWYPLCRRVGAYTVTGFSTPIPIDDEGTVSDAIARVQSVSGNRITRVHQALFRWNGWSPVAEPPGLMLSLDDQLAAPAPQPDSSLPFCCTVRPAAGTLPSLRYGRSYRFRARLVDIAGRSVPFRADPVAGEPATRPLRYHRYEPVPAPVLVPRSPMTYEESVTVLVTRTDNSNPALPVRQPACERHLLPPKAAVQMLERHGVLDLPRGHRLDPAIYELLRTRDGGEVTGVPDVGAGGAPYVDIDKLVLPYLPDPLSRGIAVTGLPGHAPLRVEWPHGASWHQQFPLRLIVQPGGASQAVVVDPEARVVRVTLAPAQVLCAAVSSLLRPGDEDLLGLWQWFAESDGRSGEEIAEARAEALAGGIGQLTPATQLRMVHAVRCPVEPPAFTQAKVLRGPGQTSYELDDPAMMVHLPSTLEVHAEATWTEVLDTGPEGLTRSPGRAVLRPDVRDLSTTEDPVPATAIHFRAGHELSDTRHRLIRYTPVGSSRFTKFFTERRTVVLNGTAAAQVTNPSKAFVPGTVVVRAAVPPLTGEGTPAEPGATYSLDRDVIVDEPKGQIKRREGGAVASGARVEVSFVATPVTRDGPTIERHVPATVRPPAPVVHSVVPAFGWTEERTSARIVSTRQSGVVRVYLARPWYVTGEDELLAITVLDQSSQPDAVSQRWATTWGRDPIRAAEEAPPLAYVRETDLGKDSDTADVLVQQGHAIGYEVEFDEARKLWYADIRFKADLLYEPFVKLRIARLQQYALTVPDDIRLSTVVDAGFVQLPPFRRTTVVPQGSRADVTIIGGAPPSAADGRTTEMTAAVQVRTGNDALSWQTLGQSVTIAADPALGPLDRWRGSLTLPAAAGSRPMRVLIREWQQLPGPENGQTTRRIAYLDTMEL